MTRQFAAMVIFYNGRYLFEVRSSPLEQKGLLALPGGKWQAVDGPRLEATATREVQEELGVCLGAQSSASVDFVPCGRDFGVTLVRTFIANRPLGDSEYARHQTTRGEVGCNVIWCRLPMFSVATKGFDLRFGCNEI